jgi:hypothetical protein
MRARPWQQASESGRGFFQNGTLINYPFVVSMDGLLRKEAKILLRKLSAMLSPRIGRNRNPNFAALSMLG